MRKIFTGIMVTILVASLAGGCGSRMFKGGAIGAGAGGILGGIIGKQYGDTSKGAIIGAAVGGTAGAAIGHYMDKQAEELRAIENAKVERVGEGINLTFDSGILFSTDSSTLEADAQASLVELAGILTKYPDTNILIQGHTDSTGSEEYNQKLSERRAGSVQYYLSSHNVTNSRMSMVGFGETQPVASNDTVEGRQQNRRVEIAIIANDILKENAKDGQL